MRIDLSHYSLWLESYNVSVGSDMLTEVTFVMKSSGTAGPSLEEFSRDVSVMNAIRSNNDPAVRDQWEALLTTIALTSNRNVPDVIDSMTSMQSASDKSKR